MAPFVNIYRSYTPSSSSINPKLPWAKYTFWMQNQSTVWDQRFGQRILAKTQFKPWSMALPSRLSNSTVQGFSKADDGCATIPILVLTREVLWSQSPNSPHPSAFWFVAQHSLRAYDLDSLQRKWNWKRHSMSTSSTKQQLTGIRSTGPT